MYLTITCFCIRDNYSVSLWVARNGGRSIDHTVTVISNKPTCCYYVYTQYIYPFAGYQLSGRCKWQVNQRKPLHCQCTCAAHIGCIAGVALCVFIWLKPTARYTRLLLKYLLLYICSHRVFIFSCCGASVWLPFANNVPHPSERVKIHRLAYSLKKMSHLHAA